MSEATVTVYEKSKARRAAAVVLLAVIVIFTIAGLNRSVSHQAKKTAALFDADFGIAEQLGERMNAARGLAALAAEDSAVSGEYEALRTAYNSLYDASSVHDKYTANTALETAWQSLYTAMNGSGMDSETQRKADYYADILTNAQRCIENDGYNAAVAQFQTSVMQTPVTRLLHALIFTELPEAFA